MTLMESIQARRSMRYMTTDPISEEAVLALPEAARLAPSWANRQCWRFVVVRDEAKRQALATCGGPPQAMNNAPVIIVACAYPDQSGNRYGQPYYMLDTGIAVEHIV